MVSLASRDLKPVMVPLLEGGEEKKRWGGRRRNGERGEGGREGSRKGGKEEW